MRDFTVDLGHVLCELPDVFYTSKTDFYSISILLFTTFTPPDIGPVFSRPYRINPIIAEKADAVLDPYLAAGLIQHSTFLYASPVVAIPKTDISVLVTVNHKYLNSISSLG